MPGFDEYLNQNTTGVNGVPGCVLMAVDRKGGIIYSGSAGRDSVKPCAAPIDPKGVFWLASCSKVVGTIAALQCVERGLITLDEPVSKLLPELSNLKIIAPVDGKSACHDGFHLKEARKQTTLRQLLIHTDGMAYDIIDPTIMAWRSSRGEEAKTLTGRLDSLLSPLKFDPGEGWAYGPGIDWAGLLVSRLNNNIPLEVYMHENIFTLLGLESTSFRFEQYAELQRKLVGTLKRREDGSFENCAKLWPDNAPDDCAGAGLYSTADEFIRIIGDLVKETPTVLKRETVEQMFKGQLPGGSNARKMLNETPKATQAMTGMNGDDGKESFNFGIGGMYFEEDVGVMRAGTLCWGGLPNLYWFANRREGVAGFYASAVLPTGDPASGALARAFWEEVFRLNSR